MTRTGRGASTKDFHNLKIHEETEKLWMEQEGHKQRDQCSLSGGLNLAPHYPPSHKLGLSESFIKIHDRPDITAAV